MQLECTKRDLSRRTDWTDQTAFHSIDSARDGFLGFENILAFCRLNGFRPSDSEVIAIVRRMDVDADQRVNNKEFRQFMAPVEDLPRAEHTDSC